MMKGLARAAIGLAALAALTVSALARADDDFRMLGVDDVEKMMKQPDVKVYDANPPDLWEKSHVPGATFIGEKKLASILPQDKGTKLVFYCAGPK
jgi:rhodanese-related sulfurtransferase